MTRQQRANNNFHHTESPFGNFLPFFFLKPSINMWLYLDVCDEPVHKGESLQGKMKCNHVKGTVGCGNYGRGGDLLSPLTVTNTNAHNDDTSGRNYPWNSLIVVLELNLNYSQISHRFSKKYYPILIKRQGKVDMEIKLNIFYSLIRFHIESAHWAYLGIMNQTWSEKPRPQNVNNWKETNLVFLILNFKITKRVWIDKKMHTNLT